MEPLFCYLLMFADSKDTAESEDLGNISGKKMQAANSLG